MSGHGVALHQGPDGADVPQGLVKGEQLGREVERGEAPAGAAQAALLLTGQRRNGAPQQGVRLHRRTQEGVGILGNTEGKRGQILINEQILGGALGLLGPSWATKVSWKCF